MKNKFLIIFLSASILAVLLLTIDFIEQNKKTFSNTQTWGEEYNILLQKPLPLNETTIYNHILLKPSPQNTSQKTREDLAALHQFKSERTAERLIEIEKEKQITNAIFGDSQLQILLGERPQSIKLIHSSLFELSIIIMHYKEVYNRARPSFLDTSLTTTIDVPEHPAYPSGHAAQSYFIALLLSELDPKSKASYMESAYRIGHNREIAGVHYPSDSEAGRELAAQYFEILRETPWYKQTFEEAKKEW